MVITSWESPPPGPPARKLLGVGLQPRGLFPGFMRDALWKTAVVAQCNNTPLHRVVCQLDALVEACYGGDLHRQRTHLTMAGTT